MLATMAAPKTSKPAAKAPRGTGRAPAGDAEGRKKSILSRTGDEAKRAAERALLLKTLRAKDWNLTHTAEALEMPGPSQVLRAIKDLHLADMYEQAKANRV